LRIVHLALAGALALSPLAPLPLISPAGAQQRAPESFAPLARELLPAVVNISTSKNVAPRAGRPNAPEMPQFLARVKARSSAHAARSRSGLASSLMRRKGSW